MQLKRKMLRLKAGSKRGWSRLAFVAYGTAMASVGLAILLLGGDGLNGTPAPQSAQAPAQEVPAQASAQPTKAADVQMPAPKDAQMPTPKTEDLPPAKDVVAAEIFRAFIADLRIEAAQQGVPANVFDKAFDGVEPDSDAFGFTTRQPEHERAPWAYVEALVSDKRIEDGQAMLLKHADTLNAIEFKFGVDKHIVLAIWGIESSYGSSQGGRNIIRSLATLAFQDERRGPFWKKQLIAALQILASGDIAAKDMGGSWAGAMGHTQFMPTTFKTHAVDFDGDGRRDIWGSVPDALASAANYLKASRWRWTAPWGFEIVLPDDFDFSLSAPGNGRPLIDWLHLGVQAAPGSTLPISPGPLELLLPAGAKGPAFLVTSNFKAILRYNNSALYALAAGHLAERLAGGGPISGTWPRELEPLNRDERKELQKLLVGQGLETGGIDGIFGRQSRASIRTYQKRAGFAADGYPTKDLLTRLRLGARLERSADATVK